MGKEALENAVTAYLKRPQEDRLDRLEKHVWQRIRARQLNDNPGWLERLLEPIFIPQYRFATIALAMALGLSAGEYTKAQLGALPSISAAQMLNLDAFSPDKGLLFTNLRKERT